MLAFWYFTYRDQLAPYTDQLWWSETPGKQPNVDRDSGQYYYSKAVHNTVHISLVCFTIWTEPVPFQASANMCFDPFYNWLAYDKHTTNHMWPWNQLKVGPQHYIFPINCFSTNRAISWVTSLTFVRLFTLTLIIDPSNFITVGNM